MQIILSPYTSVSFSSKIINNNKKWLSYIIKLIYWMVKWRGFGEGLGFIPGSLYIATQIDGRKLAPGAGTDSSRVPASWEEIWP